MNMMTFEIEGWVNDVSRGKYGVDIVLRLVNDESTEKYPQRILLTASVKNSDKIPDSLDKNDKVKVIFAPFLNEGVAKSTQRVYKINKNMIQELTVVETAPHATAEAEPDDCPF